MRDIHPTAQVDANAQLGKDVYVGPFCLIGPNVSLGDGCKLIANVHIAGRTTIGPGCTVHSGAVLGGPPQILGYGGEETRLKIGANCVIREHVTIDGTTTEGCLTRVGSNGFFMTKSHIAHDCEVGDGAIFANGATLAGHCTLGTNVFLSGNVMVHQFSHIGRDAIVGGGAIVIGDIIPFGRAFGAPARLVGINIVGLKRRDCPSQSIAAIRRAYRLLFLGQGLIDARLKNAEDACGSDAYVNDMLDFIRQPRKRPLCPARMAPSAIKGSDERGEEGAGES